MRRSAIAIALSGLAAIVVADGRAFAGTQGGAERAARDRTATSARAGSPATTSETRLVTYRPPLRGAPTRRIGGSSRSPGVPGVKLVVFAAEDTGLTIEAQPSFYWYLSRRIDVPAEFTLTDPNRIGPVLRTVLKAPNEARVHSLSLSDHGVRLTPGIDYEWSVALILDAKRRSKDVVSSGTIRRIAPSPRLARRIAGAPETQRLHAFAESGLWYDAIAAASRAIAERPEDRDLWRNRADLLRQVGLSEHVPLIEGR